MTREQESTRAYRLQEALGEGYTVAYDCCESCFTNFYFHGELYKKVLNTEFSKPSINVNDYTAPQEMLMKAYLG